MRPHISLNVRDVPASVEFYRKVFGVMPQKQTVDYAKFDLTTPPLNFSLVSSPDCTRSPQPRQDAALPSAISAVNHLGIEVDNPGEVSGWEGRLREHGIVEKVEDNIECCFARQDKVWFTDPDGNQWEIFTVHEQLPVSTSLKETSCCAPTCCVS